MLESRWEPEERALQPPLSLLAWLVRNLLLPEGVPESEVSPERRALANRDPARIEEALTLLRSSPAVRAWYVLEGPSYPDAFLATHDILVVIEGKRTEAGPTTATTWMPRRHQMLRHLDAALEVAGSRSLYGFFIVEGEPDGTVPPHWQQACSELLAPQALEESLPHRPDAECERIARAFLGAATWQHSCAVLGVPFESLPERVAG